MSMQVWLIVFAVWTVSGLLAAIVLGHMVPYDENERDEATLAPAVPNVKHFRRNKRISASRPSSRAATRPDTMQRGTPAAAAPHRKS